MKQTSLMGIVLLVGLGTFGAAWIILPQLQGSMQFVESSAAVPLERARRLLHEYDARLPYQAGIIDELQASGATLNEPDDLSEEGLDDYQQIHERLWTAFQPMQWGDRPTQARANYGASDRQMREGVASRSELLTANDKLLEKAAEAVDEALSVSSGDASGRDLSDAQRIRGMVFYYQGMAESIRGAAARNDAAPIRAELAALADEALDLSGSMSLISMSEIDQDIERARGEAERARLVTEDQRRVVAGLDRSLADLRQQISGYESQRDQAKAELDALEQRGLDFSLDNPAASYSQSYLDVARRYREASRRVQDLITGYFPHARIDASGDFLTGRYVENGSPFNLTIERGLNYLEREQSIAAEVLRDGERSLREWEAVQNRLKDLRAAFATKESEAQRRLAQIRRDVTDLLDAFDATIARALEHEDAALAKLDQSARAVQDAAGAAGRWISDAQQRTQSLPMQSQENSAFKPRTDDRWIGGFSIAQAADARLARAWVFHNRYSAANETAAVMQRVVTALDMDADLVTVEHEDAAAAREAGIEEVKLAMADLERAHRDAEGHWTLVAQAGSTEYLMALFGDASYVADTIATYRKAVENREDAPAARAIVSRLQVLESR